MGCFWPWIVAAFPSTTTTDYGNSKYVLKSIHTEIGSETTSGIEQMMGPNTTHIEERIFHIIDNMMWRVFHMLHEECVIKSICSCHSSAVNFSISL